VKVFLDTNVIVSAVATRGICTDLFQAILAEHELVLGETVLGELRTVLGRKIRIPRTTIEELDAFLRTHAAVVQVATAPRVKGLTPADAAVLGEAVAARAEILITGDHDLLRLADPPLKIVSPRGMWDVMRRAT
jgi:putative PIN family toxin of toxin-antitoxin system